MKAKWVSTSNGVTTEKEGEFIGEIPAGKKPIDLYPWLKDLSQNRLKFGTFRHSSADRCLVKIDRQSKSGAELAPLYYAPRASVVSMTYEFEVLT